MGQSLCQSPADVNLAEIVAEARLKSSFIYLANAVHDLTGNRQVMGLTLAPVVLLASLCLLPDALNLQHFVYELFKTRTGGANVLYVPVQVPYGAATHIEPLVPQWVMQLVFWALMVVLAVAMLVMLCTLKWIQEGHGEVNALDSTLQIYRNALNRVLPFCWIYLLQLISVTPIFVWVNYMLPLELAVPIVVLAVPGFLAFVWLSVAQYALVLDGRRTWLALFYSRELIRKRFLKVALKIIVFLALWTGFISWAGGAFVALSLILGLVGAFAGALWAGVFVADLLGVSVLFATTLFCLAAGLRLYQDLKATAPAGAVIVESGLTPDQIAGKRGPLTTRRPRVRRRLLQSYYPCSEIPGQEVFHGSINHGRNRLSRLLSDASSGAGQRHQAQGLNPFRSISKPGADRRGGGPSDGGHRRHH